MFAHVHAVLSDIESGGFGECSVGIEDVDGFKVVGFAEVVVIDVMSGSDFQTSRSEFNVHVSVFNDGNDASHERHDDFVTAQPLVLRVFGVDAHGGVAHDGFRTCGSDHGIEASVGILVEHLAFTAGRYDGVGVGIGDIVAQVEEMTLFFFVDNLDVGQGSLCFRIPVDHAQAAIDESFVIEVTEDAQHTFASFFVHGEGGAFPVAGSAEASQLLEDDAAVFVGPVPSVFQELVACQVLFFDALLCETVHHLGFGGDGGVVRAGHPACVLAFHASVADENVLNRVVEHVSHVQHACYVWRRNDYCVGFSFVGGRLE